jgi:hypothetical protein
VRMNYNPLLYTGRLVVDMVRFVPLANSEDADTDGLADWWMMDNFGHRSAQAGDLSRSGDAPVGDGIPNLAKYALGLNAFTYGTQGRLVSSMTFVTNQIFLSVTYRRPEPPPTGVTYAVELSPSLFPAVWTTNGTIIASNTVNSSLRTITIRDSQPVGEAPQKLMRFKLSHP